MNLIETNKTEHSYTSTHTYTHTHTRRHAYIRKQSKPLCSKAMRTFISLWLLATFATAANAILCYECDSMNEENCGGNFMSEDIAKTDCEAIEMPAHLRAHYSKRPKTACLIKYYQGMTLESPFIRRSCYFGELSDLHLSCHQQQDPLVPDSTFMGCQVCYKDLCNASAHSVLSISTIFGCLLMLILYMTVQVAY